MTETNKTTIRIWDLPVRLMHWAIVVLVAGLWGTHRFGLMDWHIKLGMALLFIVTFRIVWGLVGSETARFASFVKGPGAIRAYLASGRAKDGSPVVGHNPLGALSVIGLIGLLAAQVGLGLFATDTDAVYSGPLNSWVSFETAEKLTHLHGLGFNLILLLVGVHLAAIIFYTVRKKDRLVAAMVTGRKDYSEPVVQPKGAPLWRLGLALLIAFAACGWVWNGGHFMPQPKSAYEGFQY